MLQKQTVCRHRGSVQTCASSANGNRFRITKVDRQVFPTSFYIYIRQLDDINVQACA